MVFGYAHELYARSLSGFGEPISLPSSGGWLLRRRIPGSSAFDAMGCYPIFACPNWAGLCTDLNTLRGALVSVALVSDPFGSYSADDLRACFARVVPFKSHHLADLSRPLAPLRHHRYYARRALRTIRVERMERPVQFVDEWASLYSVLIRRHELTGMKAFSRQSFEQQLSVPGIVALRASEAGQAVAAHLWYVSGNIAYSHLMAMNERGYELRASYALYSEAIARAAEFFGPGVTVLDLGAGAGIGEENDGLNQFKRGWSNDSRMAYFCAEVMNPVEYAALTQAVGVGAEDYFPAYRRGEFA